MIITEFIIKIKEEVNSFEKHYQELNKLAPKIYPLDVPEDGMQDWFMLFIDFHINGSIV